MSYATVVQHDSQNYELAVGDRIEVIGWVIRGSQLQAIWRDDQGYVWEIAASVIRMEPNAEAKVFGVMSSAYVGPTMTNAIAGPQTGRGVR
jgi:hypothetical protein